MGTFFSTFQVKSNQSRTEFEKGFTDYMKRAGFMPAVAKDAEHSIILAFSKNWVTVCPSYDVEDPENEARELAKVMKTACVSTNVYDSDCVYLYLYDGATNREDKVLAGRYEDYEEYFEDDDDENYEGNPDCWTPFLVEDATWEQLTKIWKNDYVFAEEALHQMAPLLGIDEKNIAMDYQFWQEGEPDSPNIITLYFQN